MTKAQKLEAIYGSKVCVIVFGLTPQEEHHMDRLISTVAIMGTDPDSVQHQIKNN